MKTIILFLTVILSGFTLSQTTEIWGTTLEGGEDNKGVIFKTTADGTNKTLIHEFLQADGEEPTNDHTTLASNGKFYGTLFEADSSVLYEFDPATQDYTVVHKFDNNANVNGSLTEGSLMEASNGKLYGMTRTGGANDEGVIYEFDYNSYSFQKLHDFDSPDGSYPYGYLIQSSNGKLYGLTHSGGTNNEGVIFEYDINTDSYTKLHDFDQPNGRYPKGALTEVTNGVFYGLTVAGGTNDDGTIFSYDLSNNIFTSEFSFEETTSGRYPQRSLFLASDGSLYGVCEEGGSNNDGTLFSFDPTSGNFTKEHDFENSTGRFPACTLREFQNGVLFGTTYVGGSNNDGVIFKYDITIDNYTMLHEFSGWEGTNPIGGLTMLNNNEVYGLTHVAGGYSGEGSIYKYDINNDEVSNELPIKGLINGGGSWSNGLSRAQNGKLYGTGVGGVHNGGVLYSIDPLTHHFEKLIDFPFEIYGATSSRMYEIETGSLYGITYEGGTYGAGTIFKYDYISNTYDTLHNFSNDYPWGNIAVKGDTIYGTEGSYIFRYIVSTDDYSTLATTTGNTPNGVVLVGDKLYGVCYSGGANGRGTLFEYDLINDVHTVLHDFVLANGGNPYACPTYGDNGILYGTTTNGGANNEGTIFEFNISNSTLTHLHDLSVLDGTTAYSALMKASNGNLYGTFQEGGQNSVGTIVEWDITNATFTKTHDFNGQPLSAAPQGILLEIPACTVGGINTSVSVVDDTTLVADLAGVSYQWLDCDNNNQPITGATDQTYAPQSNGNYAVQIIDNATCVDTSDCTPISILLNNKQVLQTVNIYPNPATDMIHISANSDIKTVRLLNLNGQLIKQTNAKTIAVGELNPGVYFVQVTTQHGIVTKRIIKE